MATKRTNKQLLTSDRSKLTKTDLPLLLRHPSAWQDLPLSTREKLYSQLPAPLEGDSPHDLDVNPLDTDLRQYIEGAFRQFQEDLKEGRETRKWKDEALEAGELRRKGEFDGFKEAEREMYFGRAEGQENEGEGVGDGEGEVKDGGDE